MTIIAVQSQWIFKLNVVEQAEKRIAQREIIAVTEKVNAPAAVQVLFNRDFAVLNVDINIATAPILSLRLLRV